jgi:hypothetical protein
MGKLTRAPPDPTLTVIVAANEEEAARARYRSVVKESMVTWV